MYKMILEASIPTMDNIIERDTIRRRLISFSFGNG